MHCWSLLWALNEGLKSGAHRTQTTVRPIELCWPVRHRCLVDSLVWSVKQPYQLLESRSSGITNLLPRSFLQRNAGSFKRYQHEWSRRWNEKIWHSIFFSWDVLSCTGWEYWCKFTIAELGKYKEGEDNEDQTGNGGIFLSLESCWFLEI